MSDLENTAANETQLGSSFDPQEAKRTLRLTDLQFKAAMTYLRGANLTQCAKAAGYSGSDDALRTAGSRVFKSKRVQSFLAWAKMEGAGLPDEDLSSDDLKKILSKHARGEDKSNSIRAIEVLHKIELQERAAEAERGTPQKTLDEIANINPLLAMTLAEKNNITWQPSAAQQVKLAEQRRQYAIDYLDELKITNDQSREKFHEWSEADQHTVITHTEARAEPANEARNAQAKQFVSSGAQA